MTAELRVERIPPEQVVDVVSVIAEAFTGYPVMVHILGGSERAADLERLVRMFVMARVLRGEPLLGIRDAGERGGSGLIAAGIVSFPGPEPAPQAFTELRAETWRVVGADAEKRHLAYGDATAGFPFPEGRTHLNMIGARRANQRRGCGRAIIDAVQEISRSRPDSRGVTLTTERPENVVYYEALGFELIGHARVTPTLESWGFFRPNERG